jgi:CRISPR system Cascade subunit CasA
MTIRECDYSLLDMPWIKVTDKNGAAKSLGLVELFDNITDIKSLSNDTTGQDISILRFLIAITYRANDPILGDDWEEWYNGGFPSDRIVSYLKAHRDDFWLKHHTKPFMQTMVQPSSKASEQIAEGKIPQGLLPGRMVIDDSIGDSQLMANRRGESAESMTPEDAARWLLVIMNYDVKGLHSSYLEYPYGGDKIHAAFSNLMRSTVAWASSEDLGRTILLNTIPLDSGLIANASDTANNNLSAGVPAWERAPVLPADCNPKREPAGRPDSIVDMLTWRSRIVRFFFNESGKVDMMIMTAGLNIDLSNGRGYEPMSLWRLDKKSGAELPSKIMDISDRETWHGMMSLFQYGESDMGKQAHWTSNVMMWLRQCETDGILPSDYTPSIHMYTLIYDSNAATVKAAIADELSIPVNTMLPENRRVVYNAMKLFDTAVDKYKYAIRQCFEAQGASSKDAANIYTSSYITPLYMDGQDAFHAWIASFSTGGGGSLSKWASVVTDLCTKRFNEFVVNMPDSAYYGKVIRDDKSGKTRRLSVATASSVLRWSLTKLTKEIG